MWAAHLWPSLTGNEAVQTGTYISGVGHLALIGWAFLGGAFQSEPLPFDVQEVAVISTDDFNALMAAQEPPGVAPEPAALAPPESQVDTPDVSQTTDDAPDRAAPEAAETTPPDDVPAQTPIPVPPAEIVEDTPQLIPPSADVATLLPPNERPQPRPSDRVTPQAVAPPDPETTPDIVEQDAVIPEEGEAEVQQDAQEATSLEESAPEIVTEAEEPAGAPVQSLRPLSRPSRPAVAQTPTETSTASAVQDAVAAAIAAQSQTQQPPQAPVGPPLSSGERDALRVSVSNCWNVGSLSTAALSTTVVVGVDMQEDGRPVTGSIRMIDFSGGSESAARQAFEAARRAIIRCGARGFPLPVEKYAHWREIEMTFNPENMRIR